jgi:rhamnosyltransferase
MDVSIVIRTKNEADFIGETLTKVREQEFDGGYEIIVIDSGSTDHTLEIIKEHDVRLVEISQTEFTYGRSLNVGASNAEGEFIVNLSAHAFPRDKKWLTSLIDGFEDSRVAGAYGRQLSDGHLNPFEALKNESFFGTEKAKYDKNDERRLKDIHFSNSNSAIRKDVWNRFRFDEKVRWAEDVLWQRAVTKAGFSIVYVPDAAVYHTHEIDICNAYRISKDCAQVLALMTRKRRSISRLVYDVGAFLALIPNSLFQNVRYICRNNYYEHLKIAPFFVMSALYGWLVGRIGYRLGK